MSLELEKIRVGLNSKDLIERFKTAIHCTTHSYPELRDELESCRRNERVRHIKMALDKAIFNLTPLLTNRVKEETFTDDYESYDNLRLHLKNEAIDEFSGIILHELAPKIGLLEANLKDEFTEYEASKAKVQIHKFSQIFQAIECLRKSTNKPERIETDLYQLIKDLTLSELENYQEEKISVHLQGIQPCVINSDPALLCLALSNGVRNSHESLLNKGLSKEIQKSIVISWGVSDVDTWISIEDNGTGIQGNPKEAFKIGNTNKHGHTGFGMAIVKQVMENLGGVAELSNVDSGGAKLLLRWGKS